MSEATAQKRSMEFSTNFQIVWLQQFLFLSPHTHTHTNWQLYFISLCVYFIDFPLFWILNIFWVFSCIKFYEFVRKIWKKFCQFLTKIEELSTTIEEFFVQFLTKFEEFFAQFLTKFEELFDSLNQKISILQKSSQQHNPSPQFPTLLHQF